MTIDPSLIFGPLGALAISLTLNALFFAGKILARNVVPREVVDELHATNKEYVEKFGVLTEAVRIGNDSLKAMALVVDRLASRLLNGGVK